MRVLLVEDTPYISKAVVKALKASGYAVDAASDGYEGWLLAKDHAYDVIILDIMLPTMDGREVLRLLREANHPSPVLFLTAMDRVEDRVQGLKMGADDYLVKSFAIEELLARVEALSRRKYLVRSPILQVQGLILDQSKKTVTRDGVQVELPPQLFNLLQYLMLRKGQVVSRTQIEEHLYDEQVSLMSNVVDTAVCALRKALQGSPDQAPLIHTRRGLGYVIEDSER